jgi:hypothetical protein
MRELIAKPVLPEEIDEHDDVGLLGRHVPVRGVPFGFEEEFQAADVPVACAVASPVEFSEILVAVELAEDAVGVPGDSKACTDIRPVRDFVFADHECQLELTERVRDDIGNTPWGY